MSVVRHPTRGYRISAPRRGRYLVSLDGRRVCTTTALHAPLARQQLLFAQALPLAAALQGLELLHASAVVLGGRAIALAGRSGAGKSSLAAHLVASGATFLTDDVLAVEPATNGILAHPGAALTRVPRVELSALGPAARARLGQRAGTSDKALIAPAVAADALPLAVLYHVSRSAAVARPRVHVHRRLDPRLLLRHSFLTYLQTRERLVNQLAVCADAVTRVRHVEVELPASISAAAAAELLLEHANAGLAE